MSAYAALVKVKFRNAEGVVDDSRFANELFGYGGNHTVRKTAIALRDMSASSAFSNSGSE
jgi:hypothetical protein